jgi:hypothetical protein
MLVLGVLVYLAPGQLELSARPTLLELCCFQARHQNKSKKKKKKLLVIVIIW